MCKFLQTMKSLCVCKTGTEPLRSFNIIWLVQICNVSFIYPQYLIYKQTLEIIVTGNTDPDKVIRVDERVGYPSQGIGRNYEDGTGRGYHEGVVDGVDPFEQGSTCHLNRPLEILHDYGPETRISETGQPPESVKLLKSLCTLYTGPNSWRPEVSLVHKIN